MLVSKKVTNVKLPPSKAAAFVVPEPTYPTLKTCLSYGLQRYGQARKEQPIKPVFKDIELWREAHLK